MKQTYCKLEFRQMGTIPLDFFGKNIYTGIYNNPSVFVTPTITKAECDGILTDYSNAASEYKSLGGTKKTAFLKAKGYTISMLNELAEYVDSVAMGDYSTILLSGFTPSSNAVQKTLSLEKIINFNTLRTNVSGEIIVEIPVILGRGTIYYGCVISEGAPLLNPSIVNGQIMVDGTDPHIRQDFNKSRRKIFYNCKLGMVYYVYVFAMNNVSVSPLSDSRNLMAA